MLKALHRKATRPEFQSLECLDNALRRIFHFGVVWTKNNPKFEFFTSLTVFDLSVVCVLWTVSPLYCISDVHRSLFLTKGFDFYLLNSTESMI